MKELMNEIDTAFKMISAIPVTGDSVDAMAVARSNLRKAYAKLKELADLDEAEKA